MLYFLYNTWKWFSLWDTGIFKLSIHFLICLEMFITWVHADKQKLSYHKILLINWQFPLSSPFCVIVAWLSIWVVSGLVNEGSLSTVTLWKRLSNLPEVTFCLDSKGHALSTDPGVFATRWAALTQFLSSQMLGRTVLFCFSFSRVNEIFLVPTIYIHPSIHPSVCPSAHPIPVKHLENNIFTISCTKYKWTHLLFLPFVISSCLSSPFESLLPCQWCHTEL